MKNIVIDRIDDRNILHKLNNCKFFLKKIEIKNEKKKNEQNELTFLTIITK